MVGMCVSQSGADKQAWAAEGKMEAGGAAEQSHGPGHLRQQKSHVSLQETGQIFKADTARWTVCCPGIRVTQC